MFLSFSFSWHCCCCCCCDSQAAGQEDIQFSCPQKKETATQTQRKEIIVGSTVGSIYGHTVHTYMTWHPPVLARVRVRRHACMTYRYMSCVRACSQCCPPPTRVPVRRFCGRHQSVSLLVTYIHTSWPFIQSADPLEQSRIGRHNLAANTSTLNTPFYSSYSMDKTSIFVRRVNIRQVN